MAAQLPGAAGGVNVLRAHGKEGSHVSGPRHR